MSQGFLELRPKRVQLMKIAALTTNSGLQLAVALAEMNEQLRLRVRSQNNGHGIGAMLTKQAGFSQHQLREVLNSHAAFSRVGWSRRRERGQGRGGPVGKADRPPRLPLHGTQ